MAEAAELVREARREGAAAAGVVRLVGGSGAAEGAQAQGGRGSSDRELASEHVKGFLPRSRTSATSTVSRILNCQDPPSGRTFAPSRWRSCAFISGPPP